MKKVAKIFQWLIISCLIIVAIIAGGYLVCKYIIKDTSIYANIYDSLFKDKNDVHVELKNENFESEVEKAKCYHYLQLDENAKIIYVVLENNIENFKDGVEEVKLPSKLNAVMEKPNGGDILQVAFQDAWDAFSEDKPELFYFDVAKFYLITKSTETFGKTKYELYIGKNNSQTYFREGFTTKEQVNIAIKQYEAVEQQIVDTIKIEDQNYTYSYEKILQVHDWIVDNVSYDTDGKNLNNGNAYGTIVEKQSVCEGYAEAFKSLMDKLEVPCIVVCGIGKNSATGKEEKHAWNYVYIKGKWYGIDTTWDDPIVNTKNAEVIKADKKVKYKYFLKGSKVMDLNHIVTGAIIDEGKKFIYPELSVEDFE